MSASTSALRPLPLRLPLLRRLASTYAPPSASGAPPPRRPRPPSPAFFTGKPQYHDTLTGLRAALASAQAALRTAHIWPLPSTLPHLHPPAVSWRPAAELALGRSTNAQHRALVAVLNELHHVRHVAATAGAGDVAESLDDVLVGFERDVGAGAGAGADGAASRTGAEGGIDELGRSYAMGRRKESSARVWLVPSAGARGRLDAPAADMLAGDDAAAVAPAAPASQVLVNHLPLAAHFSRVADRDAVLRPLTLTGLLGAYNVFALVRGGGTTGQAGAVALGVARALAQIRGDVTDVLENDGALMRDTRMVERKKTGLAKARKRYTWVKR